MKKIRLTSILIAVLGLLISCKQNSNMDTKQNEVLSKKQYVSIDGLWKCTQETALQLDDLVIEPAIWIKGEIQNKLSVQGCFLWDGQFREYWRLTEIDYLDSANQIKIQDEDGSTFIGIIDDKKQRINGMVYSKDGNKLVPQDKLDFVRASDLNIERLFIPRSPNKDGSIQYSYHIPENINDGLQTSSVFNYCRDTTALYNLMNEVIKQEYGRLESFLIIKNQNLVLEEYFYNYSATDLHNIFSCTKSIVSLVTGIVFEQIKNLDTDKSIFDIFPQFGSLKNKDNRDITLKHVLTMTAGFEPSENYKLSKPDEVAASILKLPLVSNPGEQFQYNSECSYLLGGLVYELTGKTIDVFAKDNLFNPLGIKNYEWKEKNGNPHCESDIYMLPRDMVKIGLMTANNGKWHGQQIVPEQWIIESGKPHVAESDFFNYGYQWWHRSKSNKPWWKEGTEDSNEHNMFLALGYGGQYIFVIKDLNLVISMTSSDYNEGNGMAFKKIPMVIEKIIPLFE